MTFSYDKSADVLYITFEALPPSAYQYTENQSGDVLKIDRANGRVVGCTIPFFAARAKRGKIDLPEIGPVPFNDLTRELTHV